MAVFQEKEKTKAAYWDNEGHVINYTVGFSQDGNKLFFAGGTASRTGRFRLIYERISNNKMNNIFEVVMPDKPDQFNKYLEAAVIKE